MKKYIFIIILLFAISCALLAISYKPYAAMAQYKLETGLPPIAGQPSPSEGLPQYINYLFIFGLGLIAFLALAQMMIGGLTYILAASNVADKIAAKDTIKQALIGLGLLLVSYLLLNTINPDLVNLRNPNLTPTQFKGGKQCVEWNAEGLQACMDQGKSSWEECQAAACIKEIDTGGMSVEDYLKQFCKPYNCASQCKTDCKQGVWDNNRCGCQASNDYFYNLVPASQCTGKAIPPPMVNTPCESAYKTNPGLNKDKVCCETPK